MGEAHRRYSRHVNFREGWRGYLWQGRFASAPVDEAHLLAARRYVELNPVRARLAARPQDWPWSSARAHLAGQDNGLARVAPLLALAPDWAALFGEPWRAEEGEALRVAERTGRPLGGEAWVQALEARLGRRLRPARPGPKPSTARPPG